MSSSLARPAPPRQPRRAANEEAEGTPMHAVACRRCRRQKLRCSRGLPACRRCRDLSTPCDYPSPPDRKLLAAQRWQNAKAKANSASGTIEGEEHETFPFRSGHGKGASQTSQEHHDQDLVQDNATPGDLSSNGRPDSELIDVQSIRERSVTPSHLELTTVTLPPPAVANYLIGIYFSHLLNADLLFHRKTFLADFAAGRVPEFLTLSIFSLATVFLHKHEPGSPAYGIADESPADEVIKFCSSNFDEQGYKWGTASSQRVLMQCDRPNIATVQTCQNIALYRFALGETDRTDIHTHVGFQTARALKFNLPADPESDALESEIRRRCYWSNWFAFITDRNSLDFSPAWGQVAGLKFPCHEEDFEAGNTGAHYSFDDKGHIISDTNDLIQLSFMDGLVVFFSLWNEIRRFEKRYENSTPEFFSERIAEFIELDVQLERAFELLHSQIRSPSQTTFSRAQGSDMYRIFWLHGLYNTCACNLHSMIVPLFSNGTKQAQVAKSFIRASATEVVKHAVATLDMATTFLTMNPDVSRLPSMSGYAMFVAITLYFKAIVAQRKLHLPGILHRFRAALCVLDGLKPYWNTTGTLWAVLETLFADSGVDIDLVARSDSSAALQEDEQLQNSDIENIVRSEDNLHEGRSTDFAKFSIKRERGDRKDQHQSPDSPNKSISRGSSVQMVPKSESASEARNVASEYGMFSPPLTATSTLPKMYSGFSETDRRDPQKFFTTEETGRSSAQNLMSMAPGYMHSCGTGGSVGAHGHTGIEHGMNSMQNMGFGDQYSSIMTGSGMDLDHFNLWWDQVYAPFDINGLAGANYGPDANSRG